MIDFTKRLVSVWRFFTAFPIWWIIQGKSYRWYDKGTVNNSTPIRYRIETPPDKSIMLFFREINSEKDHVFYKVFVGGGSTGGTEISGNIQNKNTHFTSSKPSGTRIWKGVTFTGTMVEKDYEPSFGQIDQGSKTSGALTLDGNTRIYAPNQTVFVELSTTSTAGTGGAQDYKLEYQWVED